LSNRRPWLPPQKHWFEKTPVQPSRQAVCIERSTVSQLFVVSGSNETLLFGRVKIGVVDEARWRLRELRVGSPVELMFTRRRRTAREPDPDQPLSDARWRS
jgi:hypothetical protein